MRREDAMGTARHCLGCLLFVGVVLPAGANVTLFSGGYLDASGGPIWRVRNGAFAGDNARIWPSSAEINLGSAVGLAEAQLAGVIGTDFDYSANVTVKPLVESHLQFRIADEGRYGVKVTTSDLTFYEIKLLPKALPCSNDPKFSNAFTHCPNWIAPDSQQLITLREIPLAIAPSSHQVTVHARGSFFSVELDGKVVIGNVSSADFAVGRFGIFASGPVTLMLGAPVIAFSNIVVSTNPLTASNFALLYSTVGYEATGTKRALVRTLNDIPDSVDLSPQSRFVLRRTDVRQLATGVLNGPVVATGALKRLPGKTFGMQLWEADFSSISAEGTYALSVNVIAPGSGLVVSLQSAPFDVRSNLVSSNLLEPMSLANAEARRGADEDFWRNWIAETGSWRVGVDGAFIADRADALAGDTLTRVFNTNNEALDQLRPQDFRLVGRVTIVSGCDAQLRFEDASGVWWAVTLQAGDAGGCAFGTGPGAIRLSREDVPLIATLFPADHPFVVGHPYDIEILVQGSRVDVFVDALQGASVGRGDHPVLSYDQVTTPRSGRFGLKAWASTARFEDVQAWNASVHFEALPPGSTRIPTFLNDAPGFEGYVACQYSPWNCVDKDGNFDLTVCRMPHDQQEEDAACNPLFGQLHGFHDSSSQVAEATSHGAFLSGLMQIWRRRASGFSQTDRESLRRAIVANVLYLNTLFEEGEGNGQFAHSEMGRVAVDTNLGPHLTATALYGLSDFADSGVYVDRELAREACFEASLAAAWLWRGQIEPTLGSAVYARLARCAAREFPVTDNDPAGLFFGFAVTAAKTVLTNFADPSYIRDINRDTGRVPPWFEGVYEVWRTCREAPALFPAECGNAQTGDYPAKVSAIAGTLVTHLTEEHFCLDAPVTVGQPLCPANGFYVLPQASGDLDVARSNWVDMQSVPLADRHATLDFVNFYNVQGHFQAASIDAALLARIIASVGPRQLDSALQQQITGLEQIATGNLYWPLGLNPGIPASKVVGPSQGGKAWQGASFLYRHNAPFGRHHSGFRTESSTSKGWLDPWEDPQVSPLGGSPHREAWRIDPQNRFQSPSLRSYMTLVNGHVIWDDQWDYWNTGENGWLSGETFILGDGMFLKAALLLEDGLAVDTITPVNPYDTTHLAFFDTTHVDRDGTEWGFDDPDWIASAYASRAIHEFCEGKGFPGGRFTGHHLDERVGGLCVPQTARFFDATVDDVRATGWDFGDIDTTPWAQVSRAATGFCTAKGYVGGFFTGHQLNGLRGVVCLGGDVAHWFDSTDQDLYNSGEGFADINSVPWAQAARAATNICLGKAYSGGFFTGHQLNGLRGVVCLSPT
jgi:hypothetical protein